FAHRDPVQLRYLRKMEHVRVDDPSRFVNLMVKFTRPLYAKLALQQFDPPSPPFPPLLRVVSPKHADVSAQDLGLKLAAGMEILISDLLGSTKRSAKKGIETPLSINGDITDETIENYDWDRDSRWAAYKKRLESLGYFLN